MPHNIEKLIQVCNKETTQACLEAIHALDSVERDVLMRVFEFSPDKRFGDNLLIALNYLIK